MWSIPNRAIISIVLHSPVRGRVALLEEERAVISLFTQFLIRIPSGEYLSLITDAHTRYKYHRRVIVPHTSAARSE